MKANYQLRDYLLTAYTASLGGSPVSTYVSVPYAGTLMETRVTPHGAITAADSTTTVSVLPGGVAASAVAVGGTVVIPVSGAAAGTTVRTLHTTARAVQAGDVIRATPAGASTVIPGTYTFRIRR